MTLFRICSCVVAVSALQVGVARADGQKLVAVSRKAIEAKYPKLRWTHARRIDINCDGRVDDVFTAKDAERFYVAVVLGPATSTSRTSIVSFARKGDSQDGFCGPPQPLRAEALDADPEELPEVPEGYRRSSRCKGLELVAGDCDSFHLFWNHKTHELDWWRM